MFQVNSTSNGLNATHLEWRADPYKDYKVFTTTSFQYDSLTDIWGEDVDVATVDLMRDDIKRTERMFNILMI